MTSIKTLEADFYGVASNPTTVRNDIAFVLGLLALFASAIAPAWHMPVAPDAVLGASGALLACVVRFVHTLSDSKGVSEDVAALKQAVPGVTAAANTLLPFIESEWPGVKTIVAQASADASTAKDVAGSALKLAQDLPSTQSAAINTALEPLRNLLAGSGAPTVASALVAPVADVIPPPPAPPAPTA